MRNTSYDNTFVTYDDDAPWLVTYADLMTLLLVFFVLLYSLAFFEKEKYRDTVNAVKQELRTHPELDGLMELLVPTKTHKRKISIEDITGLHSRETALYKSINQFIKKTRQTDHIVLASHDGNIIVTVSGETLFNIGSAKLNPSVLPGMDKLISIFDDYPDYTINIKGHTDNIPISTPAFPSNWELSAIRATTVLRHLVKKGISPERLTATGYGQIIPVAPNDTEENRSRNRRVEFVLEKKEAGR